MRTRRAPRNAAFALLELLVVVTIIGILVAMVLPSYVAFLSRTRSDRCAENRTAIGRMANVLLSNGEADGTLTVQALIGSTPLSIAQCQCPSGAGEGVDDYRLEHTARRVAWVECTASAHHGLTVFSEDGGVTHETTKPSSKLEENDWLRSQ